MNEQLLQEILDELKTLNLQNQTMFTTEELAKVMRTNTDKIDKLRRTGMIKAINRGKGYLFTKEAYDQFRAIYPDADISNRETCLYEVRTREKEKNAFLAGI